IKGRSKLRNRVDRGIASRHEKTSGKGQKGQNARAGKHTHLGFEGRQTPLFQQLPKRGFTNVNRKEYAIINLKTLKQFEDNAEITPALLVETGVVKNEKSGVKVLAKGSIEKKLNVKAHKFSTAAKEAIEAAGGSVEVI